MAEAKEKKVKPDQKDLGKDVSQNRQNEEVYVELNLDQKVTIRSIAEWETGFSRIVDGNGDVTVVPNGTVRLSRNEIIAQVQSGNRGFTGFDGKGSHATYYIEDAPTRVEVGFETPDGKVKQQIFSDSLIKELFDIKDQADFERAFTTAIVTRAEKVASLPAIKRLGINDYSKIRFVENYTGARMQ